MSVADDYAYDAPLGAPVAMTPTVSSVHSSAQAVAAAAITLDLERAVETWT